MFYSVKIAIIYSKNNKLREGYLLLSVGADGQIDNILNDTIFFEDVDKLRLYNYFPVESVLGYREFKGSGTVGKPGINSKLTAIYLT